VQKIETKYPVYNFDSLIYVIEECFSGSKFCLYFLAIEHQQGNSNKELSNLNMPKFQH